MNTFKSFLKRLFIVCVPLLALYFYSEIALKANREREHPSDAGLGIAILLFFILFILFIGFIIDTLLRFRKKEYQTLIVNTIFLLPFIFFIIYIATLFSGGPFYKFVKNIREQEFIYLTIIYLVLIILGFLLVYKCSIKKKLAFLTVLSCLTGLYFYNKNEIKNHYTINKHIYYDGKINDSIIAIGSDSMSVLSQGQIARISWNRVYIKSNDDSVELNEWIKPIAKKYSDSIKCEFYNENY